METKLVKMCGLYPTQCLEKKIIVKKINNLDFYLKNLGKKEHVRLQRSIIK